MERPFSERYENFDASVNSATPSVFKNSRRATTFLSRALDTFYKEQGGRELLHQPSELGKIFESLTYEQFVSLLERINGIAAALRKPQRTPEDDKVRGLFQIDIGLAGDIHPPILEEREELFRKAFGKLQDLVREGNPNALEIVARTLHNAIYYLHGFADANKRTSRVVYFLFSPHVEKSPDTIEQSLQNVLMGMGEKSGAYHKEFEELVYKRLVEKREIPSNNSEGKMGLPHLKGSRYQGLYGNYLQFLIAWDALSPESREHYLTISDTNSFIFSYGTLPQNVKDLFDHDRAPGMPAARVCREFAQELLDVSISETEWPSKLTHYLDDSVANPLSGKKVYQEVLKILSGLEAKIPLRQRKLLDALIDAAERELPDGCEELIEPSMCRPQHSQFVLLLEQAMVERVCVSIDRYPEEIFFTFSALAKEYINARFEEKIHQQMDS